MLRPIHTKDNYVSIQTKEDNYDYNILIFFSNSIRIGKSGAQQ